MLDAVSPPERVINDLIDQLASRLDHKSVQLVVRQIRHLKGMAVSRGVYGFSRDTSAAVVTGAGKAGLEKRAYGLPKSSPQFLRRTPIADANLPARSVGGASTS
jgi:hypothetical protein